MRCCEPLQKCAQCYVDLEPADYLVIGAGAMGISFVDTLLAEKPHVSVVVVDSRASPGGHWVDSYSFVRLHQPAAFYGVASEKLEHDGDPAELTPGPEVQQYFERVLKRLVASGQVRYFPRCQYDRAATAPAAGELHSFETVDRSTTYRLNVNCKLVDAAYLTAVTPSMRPPPFDVSPEARIAGVAKISDVSALDPRPESFVVIGAGKTGIDAVLHLLDNDVDEGSIVWIVPNDALLYRREFLLGLECDMTGITGVPGPFCVLDQNSDVHPRNFRCATVSQAELDKIRTVKNVVRQGRVIGVIGDKLQGFRMNLEQGHVDVGLGALLVDCTGDGLPGQPVVAVFNGSKITLQSVITCQQTFSAAIIAHVECLSEADDERKNSLCRPVPHPYKLEHQESTQAATKLNKSRLNSEFPDWMHSCRLNMDIYLERLRLQT